MIINLYDSLDIRRLEFLRKKVFTDLFELKRVPSGYNTTSVIVEEKDKHLFNSLRFHPKFYFVA